MYETLFPFLSLKVFRHEERETQSFYADYFYIVSSQPNQRAAPVAHKFVWPHPTLKINLLLPRRELNPAVSQISVHASVAWRHPNTLVTSPIWDFYFDISEWHILSACAWTPALMLHLTNPCAKRKVLSLTKLKGKIEKKKSLGNYITRWWCVHTIILMSRKIWPKDFFMCSMIMLYSDLVIVCPLWSCIPRLLLTRRYNGKNDLFSLFTQISCIISLTQLLKNCIGRIWRSEMVNKKTK